MYPLSSLYCIIVMGYNVLVCIVHVGPNLWDLGPCGPNLWNLRPKLCTCMHITLGNLYSCVRV